ncbi:hypothetical protein NYZ99_17255 [Maribacter litopenaei]|uniref:Alpha-L-fucosidase C-terminal domain-containing protein n=1 Tax=Maribacter litopenaei TaxID=2976127 RepID=A0ABY5Y9F9_9FLAO|nr:alpha-L-fucosidase C-terminal domain-containing protein [Maribacter litopenaei]UWX54601.1 hypothetical protein NYZ99_17255 [Maribacter litopenaei]
MDINSEAIYNSHTLAPFKEDNICMTQQDNGITYFLYLAKEGETEMPESITLKSHQPAEGSVVTLLGYKDSLKWTPKEGGFVAEIPKSIRKNPPSDYVWTIKVSALK